MFKTKVLKIIEAAVLVCVGGCEIYLAIKSYKNSEQRDIEAKAEQTKIIQDMADNFKKIVEGTQGAA